MLERIYMLHARAQSGKDTCAAIMKEEYEKRGKRVIIIAFADYVRCCLDKYYGVTDYKTPVAINQNNYLALKSLKHYLSQLMQLMANLKLNT